MTRWALAAVMLLGLAWESAAAGGGVQRSYMDLSVKPCDDFFEYANGAWLKSTTIPGDYPLWGVPMELEERNRAILKTILEEISGRADWPRGSIRQKLADFYASGMDEAAIERDGIGPLAGRFARIGKLATLTNVAAEIGRMHREGGRVLFTMIVDLDDKASTRTIAQLSQGGLGLPNRDYYTRGDEKSKALRSDYLAHMTRLFELLGEDRPEAAKNAAAVLAFETRLAEASMTAIEQQDPEALYNKVRRDRLVLSDGGFPWKTYFAAVGLPQAAKELLVRQPLFFKEVGAMATSLPIGEWRTYLRWWQIHDAARYLNTAFVKEDFAFYGKTLMGMGEISPRWKRVQSMTDRALGEALGQIYVERTFSAEAKRKALELVGNLQAALRERIRNLDWMTKATKRNALKKFDTFLVKVGYPDRWRDYGPLVVDRGPLVLNVLRANVFEFQRNLDKLGKPFDRDEWGLNPQDVGAYYWAQGNEICFPAGILQPPVFEAEADDAINYGCIGMVIGHEMTHGFDDQGRQYDAKGNLRDWWTEADARAFVDRTRPLVRQYSAYRPLPDVAVNGELTLGENIADLGGVRIAFAAYMKSLQDKPGPGIIDGFTPQQRFFIGYAQGFFRRLLRPEYLHLLLNSDPHSPPEFRINGPLANMSEFRAAFGCEENSAMVTPVAERSTVW